MWINWEVRTVYCRHHHILRWDLPASRNSIDKFMRGKDNLLSVWNVIPKHVILPRSSFVCFLIFFLFVCEKGRWCVCAVHIRIPKKIVDYIFILHFCGYTSYASSPAHLLRLCDRLLKNSTKHRRMLLFECNLTPAQCACFAHILGKWSINFSPRV